LSVIFTEIIIPILEAKNAVTFHQRYSLVNSFFRLFSKPEGGRILVEIYLNYDCDEETSARDNIWERLIVGLSKFLSQRMTPEKMPQKYQPSSPAPSFVASYLENTTIPQITSDNMSFLSKEQVRDIITNGGDFFALKKSVLELLSHGILASLVKWIKERSSAEVTQSINAQSDSMISPNLTVIDELKSMEGSDPLAFESIKQKKLLQLQGIQTFNINFKKGIGLLKSSGILSDSPAEIAKFLFNTTGLNKTMIGEYLGEG
jgi:brefeldin A-inhibited guanine nucleotide-exchange protein